MSEALQRKERQIGRRFVERIEAAARAAGGSRAFDAGALTAPERSRVERVHQALYERRRAADELARRAQDRLRRVDLAVALLTVVATAVGASALVFGVNSIGAAWVEAAAALLLVALSQKWRHVLRKEWIDYRLAAEFGRALLHGAPLGLRFDDLYGDAMRSLPGERDLRPRVARVFKVLDDAGGPDQPTPATAAYAARFDAFLEGQIEHHTVKRSERRLFGQFTGLLTLICFVGTTVASLSTAVQASVSVALPDWLAKSLQYASVVLPVGGAAALLYGLQRSYVRLQGRHTQMKKRLAGSQRDLAAATTDDARGEVIREACKELTRESYEWSVLMDVAV